MRFSIRRSVSASTALLVFACTPVLAQWRFTEVASEAGIDHVHGYTVPESDEYQWLSGGAAAADYDGDGWVDLYVVRGDIGPNLLYRNLGDGTFEEVGAAAGVDVVGSTCGVGFADIDSDGRPDILMGGIHAERPRLFRNNGDGTFLDATPGCGILVDTHTISVAYGDYDRDGHVDVFLSHWGGFESDRGHLWRNDGDGTFTEMNDAAGIDVSVAGFQPIDRSFSPAFADLDGDAWPDILVAADYNTSLYFLNDGSGAFTALGKSLDDENGMGSAIGDYDNDGDLDWFVSSIWDSTGVPYEPSFYGVTGNRLYQNQGDGRFVDVTDEAGVREGFWGWGSTFADVNNDGHLDIFHVNGWYENPRFDADPSRLFISNGDGTFTERALELGLDDTHQGRGVVAFDYDHDGDLDLFTANNQGPPTLWRNDGGDDLGNYLALDLEGRAPNREALGARVHVVANGMTQMREVIAGSNFLSQNPLELHFGLGDAEVVDEIRITWPDGSTETHTAVAANQRLSVRQRVTVAPGAEVVSFASRPNPTRAGTVLALEMAAPVEVTLTIHDVTGRVVRTLLDDVMLDEGHTDVVFDGKDETGLRLGHGVYYYRMSGTGFSRTGRIAIIH